MVEVGGGSGGGVGGGKRTQCNFDQIEITTTDIHDSYPRATTVFHNRTTASAPLIMF